MNTYEREEMECVQAILGLGVDCDDDAALMAWEEMFDESLEF